MFALVAFYSDVQSDLVENHVGAQEVEFKFKFRVREAILEHFVEANDQRNEEKGPGDVSFIVDQKNLQGQRR